MLTIDSTGDRGNDFRVSFEVQDNGREMKMKAYKGKKRQV
jgi:hypothetical protein